MSKPIIVNSKEQLEKLKTKVYGVFPSKNELSSLDENTELLIVGTYIPQDIDYFYFGDKGKKLYERVIDVARKTDFESKKQRIIGEKDNDCKQRLIKEFVDGLKKQRIAFLDLFEYTLQRVGEVHDNTILACTLDKRFENEVKNHKSIKWIVPISRLAEDILIHDLSIDDKRVDYHQLICGGSYEEWIEVFKRQ